MNKADLMNAAFELGGAVLQASPKCDCYQPHPASDGMCNACGRALR